MYDRSSPLKTRGRGEIHRSSDWTTFLSTWARARDWVRDTEVAELFLRGDEALGFASPRLSAAAHWTRRQFELGYDVIAVRQDAARADPRVAETWRLALGGREIAVGELLRPLSPEFGPGLSPTDALDLYVTLTVPEIYRTLVVERGWTVERYERWLAGALIRELLGDSSERW